MKKKAFGDAVYMAKSSKNILNRIKSEILTIDSTKKPKNYEDDLNYARKGDRTNKKNLTLKV